MIVFAHKSMQKNTIYRVCVLRYTAASNYTYGLGNVATTVSLLQCERDAICTLATFIRKESAFLLLPNYTKYTFTHDVEKLLSNNEYTPAIQYIRTFLCDYMDNEATFTQFQFDISWMWIQPTDEKE